MSATVAWPLRGLALRLIPLALAVALVGTAIAYPLTSGSARLAVTWAIVLLGAALSVAHAALSRGPAMATGLFGVVVVVALVFEAVGLATGFPYGRYAYGTGLGPALFGVPFLVPLAWLMMAWPCLLLAGRLTRRRWLRVVLAAALFAAWDVVLDPQMVQAGYWTWAHPHPGLPGVGTVPLTNLAGWGLAGLVVMSLLAAVERRTAAPPRIGDAGPMLALGWMTLGGALAQAGWLGLPGSAAWEVALAVPVLVALAWRPSRASR
jgi:putative membrane protein